MEELEITVRELKRQLDIGTRIEIIDVREPYEYEYCHIDGSKSIPLRQVHVSDFNLNQEYAFICHVGERSGWLVSMLRQQGFKKARSVRGGIDAWALEIDPSLPRY